MKKLLLLPVLLFLLTPSLFSQPAQVKKVVNKVSHFSKQNNSTEQSKSGEVLYSGDEVTTGEKSFASIFFTDDKSLVIIRENSSVEIYGEKKDKGFAKNTVLNKGKLNFTVTHSKDQNFIFTTPTAVASIRGTTGQLQSDLEGTSIYVDSGSVEFRSLLGTKQTGLVESGMTGSINKDGELKIEPANEQTRNDFKRSGNTETKKVTIRTDKGDIIIEYLPDNK